MSLFLVDGGLGVVMVLNGAPNKRVRLNIWMRLVHRLRSSLSAFRFHSSVVPALPTHKSGSMHLAQMEDVLYPSSGISDSSDRQVLSADGVSSKSERRAMTGSYARYGASRGTQERQRLAGRVTRIRLEAVPAPSAEVIPDKEKYYWEPKGIFRPPFADLPVRANVLANTRTPAVSAFHAHTDATSSTSITFPDITAFENKSGTSAYFPAVERVSRRPVGDRPLVAGARGTTGMRLPAVEKVSRRPVEDRPLVAGERGTTGMRLPAVRKANRRPVEDRSFVEGERGTTDMRLPAVEKVARHRKEPSPAWSTGSSKFECGQRDVTISESSVMTSSVVFVTLTANPGPVVVQYISLQPERGFTVHLTAPTTMGAPFNYVVLS